MQPAPTDPTHPPTTHRAVGAARTILALTAAASLAACGAPTPPPIVAYDVPYVAKWQPGDARPMPRETVATEPRQRIFPACDKWPDDCTTTSPLSYFKDADGNIVGPFNEIVDIPAASPGPRPDVPAFDFTPTLPVPAAEPAPQPEAEPAPEPQPEPEKPAQKEQPA